MITFGLETLRFCGWLRRPLSVSSIFLRTMELISNWFPTRMYTDCVPCQTSWKAKGFIYLVPMPMHFSQPLWSALPLLPAPNETGTSNLDIGTTPSFRSRSTLRYWKSKMESNDHFRDILADLRTYESTQRFCRRWGRVFLSSMKKSALDGRKYGRLRIRFPGF